ncbi:MAG: ATP-binding protein [Clostridia bacterium]
MEQLSEQIKNKMRLLGVNLPKQQQNTGSVKCQICQDLFFVFLVDGSVKPCQCQQEEQRAMLRQKANLSQAVREMTFDKFNLDYYPLQPIAEQNLTTTYRAKALQIKQAAEQFVSQVVGGEQRRGILLSGRVGCGKTFLAACMTNRLLDAGIETLFLVVPDFLDEIKSTYDTNDSDISEKNVLDKARTAKVLIMDDLGAHNYSEWASNKIYSILNFRLNEGLPTIITTNLGMPEIEAYLGERTSSRIVALCDTYRLFSDKDIRILQYQQLMKKQ